MVSVTPREWTTKTGKPRKGWQVSWYDGKGKRHRKLFSGAKARQKADDKRLEVEIAERKGLAGVAEPDPAPEPEISIRKAGERWARYVERELGRERTTWEHYDQQLRDHICRAAIERANRGMVIFGDLPVSSVTAPDCEALKDALLLKLGPKMATRMMTVVRMLFNDIVRRGEIPQNPAAAVRVRQVDRGEGEVEIPQEENVRALVRAVRTEAPMPPTFVEAWIVSTIFSGLRPSENRGAAIEDLVLDGDKPGINVRRRADLWGVLGPVKTRHGRRFVPLPPAAVALLRRWLLVVPRAVRDKDGNVLRDGVADPENPQRRIHLLFPTSDATVQTLANIYNRAWVPALIKAGLVDWVPAMDATGQPKRDTEGRPLLRAAPKYAINSLRHFAASLQIAEGLDPKTIQTRFGHSSIQVTFDNYGHLFAKRAADASAITRIEQKLLG